MMLMKINRIKIDGFKNIDDVQIELNNNMLSLLSANSYGKSNFLNGIVFGFDFIHASTENKSRMMHDISSMPLNRKKLYQDFKFEIEINDIDDNDLIYGYSFSWKKKNGKSTLMYKLKSIKIFRLKSKRSIKKPLNNAKKKKKNL